MPNAFGKYSLTELARLLNVTPAFINRIQRETEIGGKIGSKGQIASFTEQHTKIFQRIKTLRELGFSFKDIKEVWGLEYDILDFFSEKVLPISQLKTKIKKWNKIPLVIHSLMVDVPPSKFSYPDKKIEDLVNDYEDLIIKLRQLHAEIKRRHDIFIKDVEGIKKNINEIGV